MLLGWPRRPTKEGKTPRGAWSPTNPAKKMDSQEAQRKITWKFNLTLSFQRTQTPQIIDITRTEWQHKMTKIASWTTFTFKKSRTVVNDKGPFYKSDIIFFVSVIHASTKRCLDVGFHRLSRAELETVSIDRAAERFDWPSHRISSLIAESRLKLLPAS